MGISTDQVTDIELKNNRIEDGPFLLPAPRFNRPNRNETYYAVRCLSCGETRNLRMADIKKDQKCRRCSAIEHSTTGSNLEDKVEALLIELGIEYEKYKVLRRLGTSVDFYLSHYNVYIECTGYWHKQTKKEVDEKLRKSKLTVRYVEDENLGDFVRYLKLLAGKYDDYNS